MKIPPMNSRGRAILMALLNHPATIEQGIERHGRLKVGPVKLAAIYEQLEVDRCLIRDGGVYTVSNKARAILDPDSVVVEERPAAAPAYRGNWQVGALNASSARRTGAAFGLDWIRS